MNELDKSFTRILIEDVLDAYDQVRQRDRESARRQLVRAIFSAIEGQVWLCREHVREASAAMGYLTPLANLALREQNFSVSEAGVVLEQTRDATLTASIRLTVRQAQLLIPEVHVDFGETGWQRLKQALTARHRITHPKRPTDLTISDEDLASARHACEWVLAVTTEIMSAMVRAQSLYNRDMRDLLDKLKSGDPAALAAYQHALRTAPEW